MSKGKKDKNRVFVVNLKHDGIFSPYPFSYIHGDEKQLTDFDFEGMSYDNLRELVRKLVHAPVSSLYYCKVRKTLKQGLCHLENDADVQEFLKTGYESKWVVDLYVEHHGYDPIDYKNSNDRDYESPDSSDAYCSSDDEQVIDYVDFYHEGEQDVVVKNITTNDPFLTKLCSNNGNFRGFINEPILVNEDLHIEDPDSSSLEPTHQIQRGIAYPRHDPLQPWNEMQPILGMRYDHPEQLKLALANYGVAGGYQLWFQKNDWRQLLVYCGRDVSTERCAWLAPQISFVDSVHLIPFSFTSLPVDLYVEHHGYDPMDYKNSNARDYESPDSSDAYCSSDDEQVIDYVDFYHEGEQDVVVKNITTNDPFMTKLCSNNGNFRGFINEPILVNEDLHIEDPDSSSLEPRHQIQRGIAYPRHDPLQPWNEMQPILGMRSCKVGEGTSKDGEGSSRNSDVSPKWTKSKIASSKKSGQPQCGFRLWASWMSTENSFQIKSHKAEHNFIPLLKMKVVIREKFLINVSLGQAILDTNPGSTCILDEEETEYGNTYFRRFYICFKGVKDGWKAGCRRVIRCCGLGEASGALVEMKTKAMNLEDRITPSIKKRLKILKEQQRLKWTIPILLWKNMSGLRKKKLVGMHSSCEPTVSPLNDNEIDFRISFDESDDEDYWMSQVKKDACIFSSSSITPSVLSKEDLKGTRIEHGFKRAFMSLFGQDADTFTSIMLLNVDQLQKQLDKDEFQEDGSMAAFWVVNNQFQKFIDSQFTLDYDSQMTDKYFVKYTGIEVKHFKDTLLQHMGNVKKSVAERTQSSGTKSEVQDDSSRSRNDTDADDADIRPIYDEEPMVEEVNSRAKIQSYKTRNSKQTRRSKESYSETWWIPTGKLFDSCTSKVDSEPTHGSNVDIPNIHKSKQTLDLNAECGFAEKADIA
ncbi:hypothetical protein Tco_1030564 [Tanacetum coccineum]|uniref:PB1-like domain-containing protein n=1 Tax=Tanacetum coccineum TaxID=301880 RepID=A0ABQ5G6K7_9ASTR